ncbi:MAG: TIM barrel protein [Bacteroidia bacterium]|nr:TIM barrel protein [Bacteroidia bacterium]
MNRREFVQTAAFAAAAAFSIPTFLRAAAEKKEIGLQLYSLRDVIMKDPKGVLKQVASFGYTELETFGYRAGNIFGMTAKDFAEYVKSLGMRIVSGHYTMDIVRGDWERTVADAKMMGQQYVVMPWLVEQERSPEAIMKVCEELNKAGEIANKYGLRMGYHNHDFEFKEANGTVLYDTMLKELDPKLVGMEMDIFWVVYAGFDPFAYFENIPAASNSGT